MASQDTNAHWRDSARRPKFYFMDANAAFPLLLFLLHIKLWTFVLTIGTVIFFVILGRFGLSIPIFKRLVISTIAGPLRIARPWWI